MAAIEDDWPEIEAGNALRAPRDALLPRYVVRGLVWCGICDLPLIAMLVPPGARYYGCTSRRCVPRVLPAEVIEQRVWSQFVAVNRLLAKGYLVSGGTTFCTSC